MGLVPRTRRGAPRGHESEEAPAAYSVIARSPGDEAIQTVAAEGFWIASLRSQ